jgi:hypothetical protein
LRHQCFDVTSGAERPVALGVQHHAGDVVAAAPIEERGLHRSEHAEVERVQTPSVVKGDEADAVGSCLFFAEEQPVVGCRVFETHCRFRNGAANCACVANQLHRRRSFLSASDKNFVKIYEILLAARLTSMLLSNAVPLSSSIPEWQNNATLAIF